MIAITILLLCLCIYKSTLYQDTEFNNHVLEYNETIKIRNIFAILIIIHHACGLFIIHNKIEYLLRIMYGNIGHLICAGFFFYSANGLYKKYISSHNCLLSVRVFFYQSLLPLLITYIIANLIKVLCKLVINYKKIALHKVFLYIIGIKLVDATHWFFIVLIFLYVLFFIFIRFNKWNVLILFLIAIFYILFCIKQNISGHWFVSILAFPVGVLFSKNEVKYIGIMKKRYLACLISLALVSLGILAIVVILGKGSMDSTNIISRFLVILSAAIFPLFIIQISLKLSINEYVRKHGDISLGLYVLHPIFITIIERLIANTNLNAHLFQLINFVFLLFLFPLAYLFQLITKKIKKTIVSVNALKP